MCDLKEPNPPYYGEKAQERPSTIMGLAGQLGQNQACRVSLKEEIAGRLHRTEQEANQARRLQRLAELADKNPEMLEMFELIRSLGLLY